MKCPRRGWDSPPPCAGGRARAGMGHKQGRSKEDTLRNAARQAPSATPLLLLLPQLPIWDLRTKNQHFKRSKWRTTPHSGGRREGGHMAPDPDRRPLREGGEQAVLRAHRLLRTGRPGCLPGERGPRSRSEAVPAPTHWASKRQHPCY